MDLIFEEDEEQQRPLLLLLHYIPSGMGKPVPKKYGLLPMQSYERHIDRDDDWGYSLVFKGRRGSRLYVGPCGAMERTIRNIAADGLPYVKLRLRWPPTVPDRMPNGKGPSFIDLRTIPEREEIATKFMKPPQLLAAYAQQLANQLYNGRWILVNCQLGQNRSAMFAIAIVVTYMRRYVKNRAEYTASRALTEMQATRRQLAPKDYIMRGFQYMGFEPKPKAWMRPQRRRRPTHPPLARPLVRRSTPPPSPT